MEKLIERLDACSRALVYAAYNYDGAKLEDLPVNIIESTGVSDTCLIEIRENNLLIEELQGKVSKIAIEPTDINVGHMPKSNIIGSEKFIKKYSKWFPYCEEDSLKKEMLLDLRTLIGSDQL